MIKLKCKKEMVFILESANLEGFICETYETDYSYMWDVVGCKEGYIQKYEVYKGNTGPDAHSFEMWERTNEGWYILCRGKGW